MNKHTIHFIGDIHGHATLLEQLLLRLGYVHTNGAYQHPEARAFFCGDLINRGCENIRSLEIVRAMQQAGSAELVMGNHDYMFVLYHLRQAGTDERVYPHAQNYEKLFATTLEEFSGKPELLNEYLNWMKTIPVLIDRPDFRLVHACWDTDAIELLRAYTGNRFVLSEAHWNLFSDPEHPIVAAIHRLTFGIQIKLELDAAWIKPRIRYWQNPQGKTLAQVLFLKPNDMLLPAAKELLPERFYPAFLPYSENAPLVVHGHYCQKGTPAVQQENVVITDYCVYRTQRLACYRILPDGTADWVI